MDPETRIEGQLCVPILQELQSMAYETRYVKCDKVITGKYILFSRRLDPPFFESMNIRELSVYGIVINSQIQHGKINSFSFI